MWRVPIQHLYSLYNLGPDSDTLEDLSVGFLSLNKQISGAFEGNCQDPILLKMAVSTSHVVVGIFLIVYSSIDPINITLPFSLIMCCNTSTMPGRRQCEPQLLAPFYDGNNIIWWYG